MTGQTATAQSSPALEVRGISKSFGVVKAVDDVSLALRPSEVTALVGDNGAGKSTIVKMISGAMHPDSGSIVVNGRSVRFGDPVSARRLGIETVHQDLALLPNLTVAANLFLGREPLRTGVGRYLSMLDRRRMSREATGLLDELEIDIPSRDALVGVLSGGQRQSVAIARAVHFASRVLVMDEPTASLGVAQSAAVLRLVKAARDRGLSVLIISHILPQILELADRIIVIRHGRVVGRLAASEADHELLVKLIVGLEAGFGTEMADPEEDQDNQWKEKV